MKTKILSFLLSCLFFGLFGQADFEIFAQGNFVNTRAIELKADTGYVNTNVILNHENSFAWFCYVKTENTYPYGYIMSSYRIDGDPYCRIQMRSSGIIRAYFNFGGGAVSLDSPMSVNDGEMHMVGVVGNRTDGYMTIWIDGEPVSSVVIPEGHDEPLNPNQPFCIGTKNLYQLYTFKGLIDDVMVFDGNVTGDNIQDIYNGADPRYVRGDILTGWWRFNEQSRDYTFDQISGEEANIIGNFEWINW